MGFDKASRSHNLITFDKKAWREEWAKGRMNFFQTLLLGQWFPKSAPRITSGPRDLLKWSAISNTTRFFVLRGLLKFLKWFAHWKSLGTTVLWLCEVFSLSAHFQNAFSPNGFNENHYIRLILPECHFQKVNFQKLHFSRILILVQDW